MFLFWDIYKNKTNKLQMKKERWFNYRPLCLVFVFLMLGSVFAFYCFYDKTNLVNNNLNCILSLIVLLFGIALILFFAIRNKNVKLLLIPLISLAIGIGVFCLSVSTFVNKQFVTPYSISARIKTIEDHGTFKTVYADSLYFDGIKTKGVISISVYDYSQMFNGVEIGKEIKFSPEKITTTNLFEYDTPSSYYYKKDVKYKAFVKINNIEFGNTKLTLAEKVRAQVKKVLYKGLSNENAELTYSALFGDKTSLQQNSKEAFQLSGVAHLLAVSGLHVGIIVAILNFVCKLLHIKKWYKVALVAVILLFYMYLCDFSSSIVRAAIMSIVVLIAPIVMRKYDSLSAIGLAGIICFLFEPLFVFDIGAIMSFSCVVGITFFNSTISKALLKTKMPGTLASSFSISASTMISILIILAYSYRTLNIISLLANVILIPLFTIGFIVCFVVGFAGIICPIIGHVLLPVNYLFDFIRLVAQVLGSLPFANFSTISVPYITIVVYFILLMLMSRITVAKPEHKMAVILPVVAILFAIML